MVLYASSGYNGEVKIGKSQTPFCELFGEICKAEDLFEVVVTRAYRKTVFVDVLAEEKY